MTPIASIGCMSSSSTTVDRSARHAVHAAKSARSGGIVTTPPVERIDLSGRTFDNFRHPRGDTAELILVRHGQTEANINGLLVGQQDVLLTDLGLRQAEATAEAVAAQAPDAIAVSPLQRARIPPSSKRSRSSVSASWKAGRSRTRSQPIRICAR